MNFISEFFPHPGFRLFDIDLVDETEDRVLLRLTFRSTGGGSCVVAIDRRDVSVDASGRQVCHFRMLPASPPE